MTENGKRLRKNWTTSHVVLTELFLLFFKDVKSFAAVVIYKHLFLILYLKYTHSLMFYRKMVTVGLKFV